MATAQQLYLAIMDFLSQGGVTLHDIRVFTTLGWSVVGLLMSHTVNLSRWIQYRPGEAKAASKERQLSRWLHNPKIGANVTYEPLIRGALRDWHGERLLLALDTSRLWDTFTLIRLSLLYRGRAIPVTWSVIESPSATVPFETYEVLLLLAADLLPKDCEVLFLADRGFLHYRLLQLLQNLGWHFRIRVKASLNVFRKGKPQTKVGRMIPAKGEALFVHNIRLAEDRLGPFHLALAHVQTKAGYEKWAILSDEPTDLHTFDEYGTRFNIEENFLDDKSGGFQLEASQIRDPDALSRLCLILAIATLYLTSTGTAVVAWGYRRLVDTHWKRGLSYLQIGWRWIEYALCHARKLLRCTCLDPAPDPDPSSASKPQDALPRITFYSIKLLS